MTDVAQKPKDHERTFFGQPRVLANLFGVELWERFSFYGMQGILLLYLYYSTEEGGLGICPGHGHGIVGAYGGLVYLRTILGAWVADRLLGAERTLFYAGGPGHGRAHRPVAAARDPRRRRSAWSSSPSAAAASRRTRRLSSAPSTPPTTRVATPASPFYLGINLGALLGPLLTGWLQSSIGFHAGSLAAAIGMAIGLIQYTIGRKRLAAVANEVPDPLPRRERLWYVLGIVAAAAVVGILGVTGVLTADRLSTSSSSSLTVGATLAYFVVILSSPQDHHGGAPAGPLVHPDVHRQRGVLVAVPAAVHGADASTRRASWTGTSSAGPCRCRGCSRSTRCSSSSCPASSRRIWTKIGDRQPSTPLKFAAGTVVMGIAFLLFIPMASTEPNSAPLLGLIGVIFVFTIAELLLSPVGLSLATKLAPEAFHTQMVALFFLSVALGSVLARAPSPSSTRSTTRSPTSASSARSPSASGSSSP